MSGCDLDQFDRLLTLGTLWVDWGDSTAHGFRTDRQHEITTLGQRRTCLTPEHQRHSWQAHQHHHHVGENPNLRVLGSKTWHHVLVVYNFTCTDCTGKFGHAVKGLEGLTVASADVSQVQMSEQEWVHSTSKHRPKLQVNWSEEKKKIWKNDWCHNVMKNYQNRTETKLDRNEKNERLLLLKITTMSSVHLQPNAPTWEVCLGSTCEHTT